MSFIEKGKQHSHLACFICTIHTVDELSTRNPQMWIS
jgi:hypothetical protein